MSKSLSPELIHDYVDDRLNEADRKRVEAHLRKHEGDAESVRQLRQLKTQLRKSRRYKLDDQFSQRVLAAIESQSATSDTTAMKPVVSKAAPTESFANGTSLNWRQAAAAIASLAAMLLLVFLVVQKPNQQPVAQSNIQADQAFQKSTKAAGLEEYDAELEASEKGRVQPKSLVIKDSDSATLADEDEESEEMPKEKMDSDALADSQSDLGGDSLNLGAAAEPKKGGVPSPSAASKNEMVLGDSKMKSRNRKPMSDSKFEQESLDSLDDSPRRKQRPDTSGNTRSLSKQGSKDKKNSDAKLDREQSSVLKDLAEKAPSAGDQSRTDKGMERQNGERFVRGRSRSGNKSPKESSRGLNQGNTNRSTEDAQPEGGALESIASAGGGFGGGGGAVGRVAAPIEVVVVSTELTVDGLAAIKEFSIAQANDSRQGGTFFSTVPKNMREAEASKTNRAYQRRGGSDANNRTLVFKVEATDTELAALLKKLKGHTAARGKVPVSSPLPTNITPSPPITESAGVVSGGVPQIQSGAPIQNSAPNQGGGKVTAIAEQPKGLVVEAVELANQGIQLEHSGTQRRQFLLVVNLLPSTAPAARPTEANVEVNAAPEEAKTTGKVKEPSDGATESKSKKGSR